MLALLFPARLFIFVFKFICTLHPHCAAADRIYYILMILEFCSNQGFRCICMSYDLALALINIKHVDLFSHVPFIMKILVNLLIRRHELNQFLVFHSGWEDT